MTRHAILASVCLIAAAYLFASQKLEIDVQVRPNLALAEASGDVFWAESEGAARSGRPDSFADLAQQFSPAVVNVQTERLAGSRSGSPEDLFEEFFGRKRPREKKRRFRAESSGSGFVISEDGYIVTNNHVVDGAEKIVVAFEDGKELTAEIVGLDPKTDLALLKVSGAGKLPAAPLGNSDKLRVGDWVMAIGNPFGLEHSVTVGILSARGRNINAGPYDDFLQTDASINPGNSGGPLIDMGGRVIGINTAINAAGQGIGFAIPINMVKELLPQLRVSGSVTRGWLGVQIQRVTPALAESFSLDEPEGALISQVFEDSPAEKAKLERGDVIIEFNGTKIENYDDLPRRVASTPPGTKANVVVMRAGKRKQLTTVLEKMEAGEEITLTSHQSHNSNWGFEASDLTPEGAQQLGLPAGTRGVVIEDVDPEGPAARTGLRRGDIVLEANQAEVKDIEDLETAKAAACTCLTAVTSAAKARAEAKGEEFDDSGIGDTCTCLAGWTPGQNPLDCLDQGGGGLSELADITGKLKSAFRCGREIGDCVCWLIPEVCHLPSFSFGGQGENRPPPPPGGGGGGGFTVIPPGRSTGDYSVSFPSISFPIDCDSYPSGAQ